MTSITSWTRPSCNPKCSFASAAYQPHHHRCWNETPIQSTQRKNLKKTCVDIGKHKKTTTYLFFQNIQSLASKEQEPINQPLFKGLYLLYGVRVLVHWRGLPFHTSRAINVHTPVFKSWHNSLIGHNSTHFISALAYFSRNGRMQGSNPWSRGTQGAVGTSALSYELGSPLLYLLFSHLASSIKLPSCLAWYWPQLCVFTKFICLSLTSKSFQKKRNKLGFDIIKFANNLMWFDEQPALAMVGTLQTRVKVGTLLIPILLLLMFPVPTLFRLL